jgi:hypothetical protein
VGRSSVMLSCQRRDRRRSSEPEDTAFVSARRPPDGG